MSKQLQLNVKGRGITLAHWNRSAKERDGFQKPGALALNPL
jgi:hypothetical protein